jgi:serine/threonine-protein kinase HipA
MTDDITGEDIASFVRDLGFPRLTPALSRRMCAIVAEVASHITDMGGPTRKRIGDAIAEQTRWLAAALNLEITIPERDALVINRP